MRSSILIFEPSGAPKLYHRTPDTIEHTRGRNPEISSSLIPPINKVSIEGNLKKRDHRREKKKIQNRKDEQLARSLRSQTTAHHHNEEEEDIDIDLNDTRGTFPPRGTNNSSFSSQTSRTSRTSGTSRTSPSRASRTSRTSRTSPSRASTRYSNVVVDEEEEDNQDIDNTNKYQETGLDSVSRILRETVRMRESPPPKPPQPEMLKRFAKPEIDTNVEIAKNKDTITNNGMRKSIELEKEMKKKEKLDESIMEQNIINMNNNSNNNNSTRKEMKIEETKQEDAANKGVLDNRIPISMTAIQSPSKRVSFADQCKGVKQEIEIEKKRKRYEKIDQINLATEILIHSVSGTPKSINMLEKLGQKLLETGTPLYDDEQDLSLDNEIDELEVEGIEEVEEFEETERRKVIMTDEEQDIGKIEEEGEGGEGEEEEDQLNESDMNGSMNGSMNESLNHSSLNHSSMSDGTLQYEDASAMMSAMLDAAEQAQDAVNTFHILATEEDRNDRNDVQDGQDAQDVQNVQNVQNVQIESDTMVHESQDIRESPVTEMLNAAEQASNAVNTFHEIAKNVHPHEVDENEKDFVEENKIEHQTTDATTTPIGVPLHAMNVESPTTPSSFAPYTPNGNRLFDDDEDHGNIHGEVSMMSGFSVSGETSFVNDGDGDDEATVTRNLNDVLLNSDEKENEEIEKEIEKEEADDKDTDVTKGSFHYEDMESLVMSRHSELLRLGIF